MSKILMYRKQMYRLQLEKGGSMSDHINKLKIIAEHRQALDDAINFRNMVPMYSHVTTTTKCNMKVSI